MEYPKERYKTLDQIETITLQTPKGSSVALTDVADSHFADSPASITRPVSYTHLELKPAAPGSSHLTACIRHKELEKEVGQA